MQEEKEKTKTHPKKEDEGPIEDSETLDGAKKEGESPKDKAKKIQEELEKTRKRAREADAQIEKDDAEVREKHKQAGGQ